MPHLMFGVSLSTSAAPDADPVGDARTAEALGFDFVSASDHPSGTHPTYETWTLLAWVAASTSRIAVASRVLSIPFRSPALTAKMAESLDRLSNGRLILGLGAGAADPELRAFGLPIPSAREKVAGLTDALTVIRGLWTESAYTYAGPVYHTDAAEMEPKAQRPIPIWLGTFGDRALAVTGRHADGWIPSLGYMPLDQLPIMRGKVLAAAEAAGRDPGAITCALNVTVAIDPDADPGDDVVHGTADEVTSQMRDLIALGFSAFNFMPAGPQPRDQVERLGSEVIPALRKE